MVNYYDVLKVSPKASKTEIKSAYRRLARKLHPDRNRGSEETALKFAAIAEAYEVLGNVRERANYDRRVLNRQFHSNGDAQSVFTSTNRHAKRWRQMVYDKRYNDIIDRMLAEERREAMAFQKVVYPLVGLYVSAFLSTALKPRLFSSSAIPGRIIIVALFAVGIIHLIGRARDGLERYARFDDGIHESILDEGERPNKPYTRVHAGTMIIGGLLLALGLGLVAGSQLGFVADAKPEMFAATLKPEFIFYPPIMAFFVDLMHSVASRLDK